MPARAEKNFIKFSWRLNAQRLDFSIDKKFMSHNVYRYTKFSELKARKILARSGLSSEPYIALLGEGLPRFPICKFINNERGKSAASP